MTRRKLDKILVLDGESTCWEPKDSRPKNEHSEIIEIGICHLNLTTMLPEKKTSYYIRPTRSKISKFCTELTGITPEFIKANGIPLRDAINKLKKEFGPTMRTWASWGVGDREELASECKRYNVLYPMGKNHINIKNLWAIKEGLNKELGLRDALRHKGMFFEGRQHCGADDAWNTAKLLGQILSS